MRFEFLMIPAAIVASSAAVAAPIVNYNFMSLEEAQQELFPDASFMPVEMTMTPAQIDLISKKIKMPVPDPQLRAWKVSTGGWLLLDQVSGRNEPTSPAFMVVYAIALDATGTVTQVEVLGCGAAYDGVRNPLWLKRFKGQRADTDPKNQPERGTVTGGTISAQHITDGVKRMLATYAIVLAPKGL